MRSQKNWRDSWSAKKDELVYGGVEFEMMVAITRAVRDIGPELSRVRHMDQRVVIREVIWSVGGKEELEARESLECAFVQRVWRTRAVCYCEVL